MKRVFNFRNVTLAIATALVFNLSATTANATEDPATTLVELKFLGNFRSNPVFEVTFNNNKEAATDYILNIRDEFGNSLYRESIGSLNKKFMLNIDEVEDDVLRVEVSSRKDGKKYVYEINRNTHVVQEVVINKIK